MVAKSDGLIDWRRVTTSAKLAVMRRKTEVASRSWWPRSGRLKAAFSARAAIDPSIFLVFARQISRQVIHLASCDGLSFSTSLASRFVAISASDASRGDQERHPQPAAYAQTTIDCHLAAAAEF
jgi:hypothetical protein